MSWLLIRFLCLLSFHSYLDEPLYQEFYGKENEEEDEDEDEEEEEEDADITHDVQGEEENDAEGEEDHVIVSSDTSVETGSSSPPSSPSMRTNPNEQSPQEGVCLRWCLILFLFTSFLSAPNGHVAEGEDGPGAEEEEQEEDVPVLTEEEKEENERRLQFLLSHGKAWCDELLLEIVDDVRSSALLFSPEFTSLCCFSCSSLLSPLFCSLFPLHPRTKERLLSPLNRFLSNYFLLNVLQHLNALSASPFKRL